MIIVNYVSFHLDRISFFLYRWVSNGTRRDGMVMILSFFSDLYASWFSCCSANRSGCDADVAETGQQPPPRRPPKLRVNVPHPDLLSPRLKCGTEEDSLRVWDRELPPGGDWQRMPSRGRSSSIMWNNGSFVAKQTHLKNSYLLDQKHEAIDQTLQELEALRRLSRDSNGRRQFSAYVSINSNDIFIVSPACFSHDPIRLSDTAQQLEDMLHTMHRLDVFHLDIKRDNVLQCNQGRIALVDFGISVVLPPRIEETAMNCYCSSGTIHMMPPFNVLWDHLASSEEEADQRGLLRDVYVFRDIYAAMRTLLEYCTAGEARFWFKTGAHGSVLAVERDRISNALQFMPEEDARRTADFFVVPAVSRDTGVMRVWRHHIDKVAFSHTR